MSHMRKESCVLKTRISKLEFKDDYKVLLTCVILTLEARKLLHKRYEAYLKHVVDKSTPKVVLDTFPIVREFLNVFLEDLSGLPPD